MNKVLLMILAGCVALVSCTINYVTGNKNDIKMNEHRGVVLDTDDDTTSQEEP